MKYLSVCSGIEAATVAWHKLGWEPVAFSEIEPFPSAVLAHRFPDVPNLGDMTKFKEWNLAAGSFQLLVGGTPCQAFSVAGLRKGLKDPRGNLMLVYGAIAAHFRPSWIVWENVPGVLSSHGGQDFASFLGMLTGRQVSVPPGGWGNSGILGGIPDAYGVAWAILDAQYFGVPQRRRRVFVVGHLGDWRRAAAVLFESESLRGNPPPRRKAGEIVALGTTFGIDEECNATEDGFGPLLRGGKGGTRQAVAVGVQTFDMRGRGDGDTVNTLCTDHASRPSDFCPVVLMDQGVGVMNVEHDMVGTLRRETRGHEPVIATHAIQAGATRENPASGPDGVGVQADVAYTLEARAEVQAVSSTSAPDIRRLTPRECERLQGFPDDWTLIPWRKGMAPDGPRYKACGNSMASVVMEWLGIRIDQESKRELELEGVPS